VSKRVQSSSDHAAERPIRWRIHRDHTGGALRDYGGEQGEASAWGVYLVLDERPEVPPWKITIEYLDGRQANAVDARRRVQAYLRDEQPPGTLLVARDGGPATRGGI
jgi:hypothetical protein